jgi:hypothetical protein
VNCFAGAITFKARWFKLGLRNHFQIVMALFTLRAVLLATPFALHQC